ncbi:hypothetical protein V1477_015320 [Vespula maculifrons]|uniref:Uncharacterized protein n=1 Tax=Vespula maculifrons TaxID=7453 RepID=A0ABD2BFG6_VESMC
MEVRIRADRISVVAEPSGGSCEYEESARIVEERKRLEEAEEEGEEEEEVSEARGGGGRGWEGPHRCGARRGGESAAA